MSRLSALLLGTAIALLQHPIALALSAQEVAKVAEKITVLIDGCSSGSGVIFNKKGNTYYVLTVAHVVDENQSFCEVVTPDGEDHDLEPANIQPIEGLDLAVVQFDSTNSYSVGKLGNSSSATIGETVYIAGAPPSSQTIPVRTLRVSPGEIIGIAPESYEGYTLIYNNATRGGMSGGPILNAAGEIIGIHGKGDIEDGTKENYGIPIFRKPSPSDKEEKERGLCENYENIKGVVGGVVGIGLALILYLLLWCLKKRVHMLVGTVLIMLFVYVLCVYVIYLWECEKKGEKMRRGNGWGRGNGVGLVRGIGGG